MSFADWYREVFENMTDEEAAAETGLTIEEWQSEKAALETES